MSDLSDKFEALESQLAANHVAIGGKLDAILSALGGAPETPTVTIADLADLLTTLNASIAGLRLDASAYYETSGIYLSGINTNTDTIITNNSLNAQRMIAAIYATFCACSTETPLLPPPIDVTPTEIVDDAKCRRIQFYLSLFTTWVASIANYGGTGAAITGDVIANLLQIAGTAAGLTATGAEIGSAVGIPGVVLGAVVGAIAGAVYTLGGSVLIGYSNTLSSPLVQEQLIDALYAANNADDGQSAFQSVIGANFDVIPSAILNFLWYSAWSNDLYSGTPEVDDSAFDGSICAGEEEVTFPPITGCISFDSETAVLSNGQTLQCIVWPDGGNISPASLSGAPTDLTADKNIFGHADLNQLWVSSSSPCHCYYNANGNPNFDISGVAAQFTTTGDYYTMLAANDAPFTITLCVDQPE